MSQEQQIETGICEGCGAVGIIDEDLLFPKNKIHMRRKGNIALCGKQTSRHSTRFGEISEVTCKLCLNIINKRM